jgi:hypothetical protein
MTDLTPNLPLLRKAVEWAEAEAARPDQENSEWAQAYFQISGCLIDRECETAYCIAGYVVQLAGRDRSFATLSEQAAHLLGISNLSHHAAAGLFDASNTIEDVRRHADRIAAAAGERL